MLISGTCHCGNIAFKLDWQPEPKEIPARACSCSFCLKHGGLWTSCPTGSLTVDIQDSTRVSRYAFGTKTAEFHVCSHCGVVPVVTSRIEGRDYAVVSVNAFENLDASLLQRAPVSFDGEGPGDRLARRKRHWIGRVEFREAVDRAFAAAASARSSGVVQTAAMNFHQGYLPGCIGRVVEMHASFYARSVGFGASFESKVASELADFCLRYDPERDGLWLAHENNVIHGSVAINGSDHRQSGAHLRWFITSDESRGRGVGSRLLGAALAFCRARGYRKVYLWTFDELQAARHLYEKHGFRLSRSQRGSQWGKEVNEQLFTLGDL